MKYLIWFLVLVLLVLHQDYWQWNDGRLIFGIIPYTLLYHVILSLAAAAVWLLAICIAWPKHLEHAEENPPTGGQRK